MGVSLVISLFHFMQLLYFPLLFLPTLYACSYGVAITLVKFCDQCLDMVLIETLFRIILPFIRINIIVVIGTSIYIRYLVQFW